VPSRLEASPVLAMPCAWGAADSEGIEARACIRSVLTLALVSLAVLVVVAPAGAKGGPPAGKGGPPPWAGGGKGAKVHKAKGAAKKAEHAARKVEKAATKAEKARERGGELNPAMTCFGLLAEMGVEFYSHYGTNPSQANAFGKCVSEHAKAKGEGGDEAEESAECEAPAEEEPAEPADPTMLDELEEPADGEEPSDDCAPGEGEPAECEAPAEEPPAENAPAELTASEDPENADECTPGDEEPGEPDEGEPEETEGATAFVLACFLPRAHANPFALCL
jgi:hypothetical protein